MRKTHLLLIFNSFFFFYFFANFYKTFPSRWRGRQKNWFYLFYLFLGVLVTLGGNGKKKYYLMILIECYYLVSLELHFLQISILIKRIVPPGLFKPETRDLVRPEVAAVVHPKDEDGKSQLLKKTKFNTNNNIYLAHPFFDLFGLELIFQTYFMNHYRTYSGRLINEGLIK